MCPADQRFMLLFTFLKKNIKKKIMVFLSSCKSVQHHAELLNYIDIPVQCIHVSIRCLLLLLDCAKDGATYMCKIIMYILAIRDDRSSRRGRQHSLISVKPRLVFSCALMWLPEDWISQRLTGSSSTTLRMILRYRISVVMLLYACVCM